MATHHLCLAVIETGDKYSPDIRVIQSPDGGVWIEQGEAKIFVEPGQAKPVAQSVLELGK